MAFITSGFRQNSGRPHPGWAVRLGTALTSYIDRMARTEQLQRLNAMSDAQLDDIGIARTDIVRYVFRDRLSL